MEDNEGQLARRSSGRNRKVVHRFVPEAAGSGVGGDFVKTKREAKGRARAPLEELQVPPDSLLRRRLSVLFARGHLEEWYEGTVMEYRPGQEQPFLVCYDDGEKQQALFGKQWLRSEGKDYPYKWLEGDTERTTQPEGAAKEHSSARELGSSSQHIPAVPSPSRDATGTAQPVDVPVITGNLNVDSLQRALGRPELSEQAGLPEKPVDQLTTPQQAARCPGSPETGPAAITSTLSGQAATKKPGGGASLQPASVSPQQQLPTSDRPTISSAAPSAREAAALPAQMTATAAASVLAKAYKAAAQNTAHSAKSIAEDAATPMQPALAAISKKAVANTPARSVARTTVPASANAEPSKASADAAQAKISPDSAQAKTAGGTAGDVRAAGPAKSAALVLNQQASKASAKAEGRVKRALDVNAASQRAQSIVATDQTLKINQGIDGPSTITTSMPAAKEQSALDKQQLGEGNVPIFNEATILGLSAAAEQPAGPRSRTAAAAGGQQKDADIVQALPDKVGRSGEVQIFSNGSSTADSTATTIAQTTAAAKTTPENVLKTAAVISGGKENPKQSPEMAPGEHHPSSQGKPQLPVKAPTKSGGAKGPSEGSPAKRSLSTSPAGEEFLEESLLKRQKVGAGGGLEGPKFLKAQGAGHVASPGSTHDPRASLQALTGGGAPRVSRTTSIAAPLSLNILPKPTNTPARAFVPDSPDSDDEPEAAAAELSDEQVEAVIICGQVQTHLAGLTRARDSIGRATAAALGAAAVNAAPSVIRQIADAMEAVDVPAKRVDMLYLVDSILQGSLREGRPGCGPGSAAGIAFPKVIAAALPRLVTAVMVSPEGVEKACKVLNIWQARNLIRRSLLSIQIAKLEAAKEAFKSAPSVPAASKPTPSSKSARQPVKGKAIQLSLASGTETVSAVLEDQYGTHNQAVNTGDEAILRRRDDSSDSDSDDEPDEHERQLRAQLDLAAEQQRQENPPLPEPTRGGPQQPRNATTSPDWTYDQPQSQVPWGSGTDSAAAQAAAGSAWQGPPGFSPNSFNPNRTLNIQLNRRGSATKAAGMYPLQLQALDYPPPDRIPMRPSTMSTGYRAPAVSTFGSGFADDDRLDLAGAGDRTFEDAPPLPREDDDWDAGPPPLPEEAPPPLPEEEPPPLPTEQPPLPTQPEISYNHDFAGEQPMDWQTEVPAAIPQQPRMAVPPYGAPYRPPAQVYRPRMPYSYP